MKYTLAQLESLMTKARLLGTLNQLNTKCGHSIYLLKDVLDGDAILYIPDDVETVIESEPIDDWWGVYPTYCNIICKTLIVLGGRNLKDATRMFCRCIAQSIDLSNFDTSKVTNMSNMFYCCEAHSLDFSTFDTSNVTDMSEMFKCCNRTLDLSSFDTSNVTNMNGMFFKCTAQSIDLSSFDTSKVTDMREMFKECKAEVKATDPNILYELNRRKSLWNI